MQFSGVIFDFNGLLFWDTKLHNKAQDLLYRINTIELHILPLRERGNDIALLSEHFLKRYTCKYKKEIKGISATALRKLREYNWPGNVRELQHAMERAVIRSSGLTLSPDDFTLRPALL